MSENKRKKVLAVTILLWIITAIIVIFGIISGCKKIPLGTKYTYDNMTITFNIGNNFILTYKKGTDSVKVKGTYYIHNEEIIELHYGEGQTDRGYITDSGIKIDYILFKKQGSVVPLVSILFGLCFAFAAILCSIHLAQQKAINDANKTEQLKITANKQNYIQDLEKKINELQKTIEEFKNSSE